MKVHLKQVHEDGLQLAGEETRDILELGPEESARQAGPVVYDLQVGRDGEGLWATGVVSVDLELQCVRCLEKFTYPLTIPDVALHVPLEGPELIDLTPHVREDILLALPAYPHCDWAGDKECAALAQPSAAPGDPGPAGDGGSSAPASPVWGALDRLQIKDPN
ncbi:MAG: hypothetical protein JSR82_14465 [Verrucomicrobia bacterium]|nr:hypothetical protein [Verrucomicrobiota bacterium]